MQPRIGLARPGAYPDVAISRVWPRGPHSERHENLGSVGRAGGFANCRRERAPIGNVVIGGQDDEHAVRVLRSDALRRPGCRHRRVAPTGFDQDTIRRQSRCLSNLLGVLVPAHDPNAIFVGDCPGAIEGCRQQALAANYFE